MSVHVQCRSNFFHDFSTCLLFVKCLGVEPTYRKIMCMYTFIHTHTYTQLLWILISKLITAYEFKAYDSMFSFFVMNCTLFCTNLNINNSRINYLISLLWLSNMYSSTEVVSYHGNSLSIHNKYYMVVYWDLYIDLSFFSNWQCGTIGYDTTCNTGFICRSWFEFWLLHFCSTHLLMYLESLQKMAQMLEPLPSKNPRWTSVSWLPPGQAPSSCCGLFGSESINRRYLSLSLCLQLCL